MSATIKEEKVMTTEEFFKEFADIIANTIKNDNYSENKKKNIDKVITRRKELICTLIQYLDIKLPKYTVDSTISVHSPDHSHYVEIHEDCEETVVRIKHVRDV